MSQPLACVIGWPVKHSRSPVIHRYWLRELGLAGDYVIQPVEPERIERFLAEFAAERLCRRQRHGAAQGGGVCGGRRDGRGRAGDRGGQYALARRRPADRRQHRRLRLPRQSRPGGAGLGGCGRSGGRARRRRRGAGRRLGACSSAAWRRSMSSTARCRAPRRLPHASALRCGRPAGRPCRAYCRRRRFSSTRRRSAWPGSRRSSSTLPPMKGNALVTDIVYLPLETPLLAMAQAGGAEDRRRARHAAPPGGARLRALVRQAAER